MADIARKTDTQSDGAFLAIVGSIRGVLKNIDKVLISEGAANARIRQAEMLSTKSDEELTMMGLHREDIIRTVFCVNSDL